MATFNLKSRAVKESAFVHLRDPESGEKLHDDEGNAVGVEIYGKASAQYKTALSNLNRKNTMRKGRAPSFEEAVEDNIAILVAITKGVQNLDLEGKVPTTSADVKAMYSEADLYWVKDQVQEGLEDTSAFMQS